MNEAIKQAALEAAGRSWFGNPSFDRAVLLGVEAAIKAMREPTEDMLNAARDWSIKKNGMAVGNDQATGCWQAMLDAAFPAARDMEANNG